jgi:hypothetical protein
VREGLVCGPAVVVVRVDGLWGARSGATIAVQGVGGGRCGPRGGPRFARAGRGAARAGVRARLSLAWALPSGRGGTRRRPSGSKEARTLGG